jgi:hypothetical protein
MPHFRRILTIQNQANHGYRHNRHEGPHQGKGQEQRAQKRRCLKPYPLEGEDDHGPATAQLTLLQVDIPIPPRDERMRLIGKEVRDSVKLEEELKKISDYWRAPYPEGLHIIVERPPRKCCEHWDQRDFTDHLHFIVEPPVSNKRNIILPDAALDIETIDEKIHDELEKIRGKVETFLKNPEPPVWIPPNSATASNQEFLKNLQIPSYSTGNPSLLFHNLDVCDNKEIEMIFGPGAHQYVVINCGLNTSQHVKQVHLQHIWLGQNPSHVGRPHEILGILLRCNSRYQRSWRQRFYEMPWTIWLCIRHGCPTLKALIKQNGLLKKTSTVRLPLSISGKSWLRA